MELGFAIPYTGSWATPDNQITVARRADELGWASLWAAQRLLYPHAPLNEYPAAPGPTWPPTFRSFLDPIVSLTYVAAVTNRIRIGTASLMLPLFNPVLLAKQLTTLDVLSKGRLNVGVSLGWSKDEYAATQTPYAKRGARFEQYLDALIAAWTSAAMDTEFVTLPAGEFSPAPVQRPHPPLFIGGYADAALHRTVKYGAGYLGGNMPFDTIVGVLGRLTRYAEEAGRDPKELKLVCRGVTVLSDTPATPGARPLTGTLDQVVADVQRFSDAGVTELFGGSPPRGAPRRGENGAYSQPLSRTMRMASMRLRAPSLPMIFDR
jgi:probable F420-dependent oxidoreductase